MPRPNEIIGEHHRIITDADQPAWQLSPMARFNTNLHSERKAIHAPVPGLTVISRTTIQEKPNAPFIPPNPIFFYTPEMPNSLLTMSAQEGKILIPDTDITPTQLLNRILELANQTQPTGIPTIISFHLDLPLLLGMEKIATEQSPAPKAQINTTISALFHEGVTQLAQYKRCIWALEFTYFRLATYLNDFCQEETCLRLLFENGITIATDFPLEPPLTAERLRSISLALNDYNSKHPNEQLPLVIHLKENTKSPLISVQRFLASYDIKQAPWFIAVPEPTS